MQRIAIFTEDPADATSFYRAFGPFTHLIESYKFDPQFPSTINWASLGFCDILFMHRPVTANHVKAIKLAKASGKKVWVDYDDDLFCVPYWNKAHGYFKDNRQNIGQCIFNADVVTVTTKIMAKRFKDINKNTLVVPNALDERVYNRFSKEKKGNSNLVLWRGSETHEGDLMRYRDEIIEVMNSHPDWKIVFMGCEPMYITRYLKPKTYQCFPQMEIMDYTELLCKLSPDVMIVPLEDNNFNRAKSEIAWLEGTMAGAACVTPSWDPWPQDNPFSYSTPISFKKSMAQAMDVPIRSSLYRKMCWNKIQSSKSLKNVNSLRRGVIRSLE